MEAREEGDKFDLLKKRWIHLAKRQVKSAKKFLQKCHSQLAEAKNWQESQHLAELLSAHLYLLKKGMCEITVNDWTKDDQPLKILLDPQLKPHEEVVKRFKKSKKLKLAQQPLKKLLVKAEEELIKKEALLVTFQEAQDSQALEAIQKANYLDGPQEKVKKNVFKELPKSYQEFLSETKIPIWVGKSAKDNDVLTFREAHGNDLWMHVADYPGSHVVIRSRNPDEETIQDALQLALYFSKAKTNGQAEVAFTQKKFVSRSGNIPGKVQVAKQKILFVKSDEKRLQRIRLSKSKNLL